MAVKMSDEDFEILVGEALDLLPEELMNAMDNVVIMIEPVNPEDRNLLGLYQGVALTERTHDYAGFLPDTIEIYRDVILAICDTAEEVRRQVAITVLHEIGHHFGIDDHWLEEHGWG
ncbi:MAG: metallopeptidase family protein [Gordonia sp. (in: high G+C Gram-positive bacteria)]|uniref:metallopeptidase family protein n=1 Tax=Gordonia sp. (in: high G+C Gram-positive bacteria) TaxID=84139 RepID=UPI0039E5E148